MTSITRSMYDQLACSSRQFCAAVSAITGCNL